MKRLNKLIREAQSYLAFEVEVMKRLRWYQVPKLWNKKDLETYYNVMKKGMTI